MRLFETDADLADHETRVAAEPHNLDLSQLIFPTKEERLGAEMGISEMTDEESQPSSLSDSKKRPLRKIISKLN